MFLDISGAPSSTAKMVTFSQIFDLTDLGPDEIILGAIPTPRHRTLLASYMLNLWRGRAAVRDLIVSDLRSWLDIGLRTRAADLLVVLRIFLVDDLINLNRHCNAEDSSEADFYTASENRIDAEERIEDDPCPKPDGGCGSATILFFDSGLRGQVNNHRQLLHRSEFTTAEPMDQVVARENVKRFRDLLWTDIPPDQRSYVQRLLVAEEDKLTKDLALLADIDRHIADGDRRVERQRALISTMERDGHKGLLTAQALLDGMIETLRLHAKYRKLILVAIEQSSLC